MQKLLRSTSPFEFTDHNDFIWTVEPFRVNGKSKRVLQFENNEQQGADRVKKTLSLYETHQYINVSIFSPNTTISDLNI